MVTELKDRANKFQSENSRLKQEIEQMQANLEAERNVFLANSQAETDTGYNEENFERRKKEIEYLIKTFGLRIENEKDYLREIISSQSDKRMYFNFTITLRNSYAS